MGCKVDWVMKKHAKFVHESPYIVWYISIIGMFQKDGVLIIPWFEYQIDMFWLLSAQWLILMQYLGLREMKLYGEL